MPAKLLADSQDWQPEFVGVEPDLADYGLQRVLICTDRDIAAMLIANHIHMELGCAVLSLSEAMPLPDMICAMLARDQAPRIFLLHDADLEGMTLLSHARVRLRIPEDMSLVEVGLRPFQAMRMHLFVERTEAGTVEGWHFLDGLSHFEGWWVKAGLRATISGISPLTLFRFLRQSIVGKLAPALATAGSGDILTGLIAGLLAQHPAQVEGAIMAAVWLHGRAGELAARQLTEQCVTATDLLRHLPEAIRETRDLQDQ
jgi:hypothetical protein